MGKRCLVLRVLYYSTTAKTGPGGLKLKTLKKSFFLDRFPSFITVFYYFPGKINFLFEECLNYKHTLFSQV